MAVAPAISVEEYLKTTYRPDCDYVDGGILERNSGEKDHSAMQRRIVVYLCTHFPAIAERVLPEQRVQVGATRFRIPDICVLVPDAPEEQIIRTAPALCIEILSRDDRMSAIMERVKDYFSMGVPVCWIVDPRKSEAWIATPGLLAEPADRIMRAGNIELPLSALFA